MSVRGSVENEMLAIHFMISSHSILGYSDAVLVTSSIYPESLIFHSLVVPLGVLPFHCLAELETLKRSNHSITVSP